jgi:hypothetical protein
MASVAENRSTLCDYPSQTTGFQARLFTLSSTCVTRCLWLFESVYELISPVSLSQMIRKNCRGLRGSRNLLAENVFEFDFGIVGCCRANPEVPNPLSIVSLKFGLSGQDDSVQPLIAGAAH